MGSRGAFIDVKSKDFRFINGGKIYYSIGFDKKNNIKYLVQTFGSVKIPDYSHTCDRIYAVFDKKGRIKSIAIYENHEKIKSIDLLHTHTNPDGIKLNYHYHTDLYHQDVAHELSHDDIKLVEKVTKGAKKFI